MKYLYSVILLSFIIVLLLVNPVIGDDEWVKYGTSQSGSIYLYNKVKIRHMENGIVQVWSKIFLKGEDRDEIIHLLKDIKIQNKEIRNLSKNVLLEEVDCKNEKFRILSVTFYTIDGKGLYTLPSSYKDDWNYIIPDTRLDILHKKVCQMK